MTKVTADCTWMSFSFEGKNQGVIILDQAYCRDHAIVEAIKLLKDKFPKFDDIAIWACVRDDITELSKGMEMNRLYSADEMNAKAYGENYKE